MLAEPQWAGIFDAARKRGASWPSIAAVNDFKREVEAALTPPAIAPQPSAKTAPQVGLTASDFQKAASRLGGTVAQIRAVDEVESGGGWFTDIRASILDLDGPGGFIDGPHLPKILFEAHIFARYTSSTGKAANGRFNKSHPNISSPSWNRALYVGGQGEWARLHQAMLLDQRAALMSASVGRYQIMGFNHEKAGFATVQAYWEAMKRSERAHLEAFVTFIVNAGLGGAFRAISSKSETCRAFAKGYNGAAYEKNNYHVKIANAHKKWAKA